MKTTHYKCEDYPNNSVYAEIMDDKSSAKIAGCIGVTIKTYSEEHTVYITAEDAMHFAETLKGLATEAPAKK